MLPVVAAVGGWPRAWIIVNGNPSATTVPVSLPGGGTIRVEVSAGADGISSVGITDRLDFAAVLDTVHELAAAMRDKLDAAMPSKATIEFGVGFTVEAGKLTSLLVGGKGDASLKITLEWDR